MHLCHVYSSVYEQGPLISLCQTQNLRDSHTTQEPISAGKLVLPTCDLIIIFSSLHDAAMSNPYQPSPQPHDNQDITL